MNDSNSSGRSRRRHTPIGAALRFLTTLSGSDFVTKRELQPVVDRLVFQSTKTGVRTMGEVTRSFRKASKAASAPIRLGSHDKTAQAAEVNDTDAAAAANAEAKRRKLFDLNPTDDQKMFIETIEEFRGPRLRDIAGEANHTATVPDGLVQEVAELGVVAINVPEEFEGIATGEDTVTNALVAQTLAYGDLSLAVAALAPAGVANVITSFGTAQQQQTYLPAFGSENPPAAAVALAEPQPLFDPMAPITTARRKGDQLVLEGAKALVPNAVNCELFVISADFEGMPLLVIVEADAEGLTIEADPSMGLRPAGLARVILDDVKVPVDNVLGGLSRPAEDRVKELAEVIARGRIGWAAVAAGTCHAVLDYVVPYVNEREAFGEPVSHRQAVAFKVADIATELDGLKLVVQRAASRADQGKSFAREAALAKVIATDKGMQIGSDGVQLLGGHGYVKEHPVERWYRDLRAIGIAEGVVIL